MGLAGEVVSQIRLGVMTKTSAFIPMRHEAIPASPTSQVLPELPDSSQPTTSDDNTNTTTPHAIPQ